MSEEREDSPGECTLCVRNVPAEAYTRWQQAAKTEGLSLSAWVRRHLGLIARREAQRPLRVERIR